VSHVGDVSDNGLSNGNDDPDFSASVTSKGFAVVGTWPIFRKLFNRWSAVIAISTVAGFGGGFATGNRHINSTAPPSYSHLTSNLEITSVTGGPSSVPCQPTVWGQGSMPSGMTAVVYTIDQNDQRKIHWFEPVEHFNDGDPNHWWTIITLEVPRRQYIIGAALIPDPWAAYLSTVEKWRDNSNTYWNSPGLPPDTPTNKGDPILVTRSAQACR